MSGILEALDAMYEVKGEAELASYGKRSMDSYRSQKKLSKKKAGGLRSDKDPYNPYPSGPMKTAKDYRNRAADAGKGRSTLRNSEENRQHFRNIAKGKDTGGCLLCCTETIDTLEGIL